MGDLTIIINVIIIVTGFLFEAILVDKPKNAQFLNWAIQSLSAVLALRVVSIWIMHLTFEGATTPLITKAMFALPAWAWDFLTLTGAIVTITWLTAATSRSKKYRQLHH